MATTRNYATWFYVSSKEFYEVYTVIDQDKSGNDFIAIKHYLTFARYSTTTSMVAMGTLETMAVSEA